MRASGGRASVFVMCTVIATVDLARGPNEAHADQFPGVTEVAVGQSSGSSEAPASSVFGVPGGDDGDSGDVLPPIWDYLSRFSQDQRDNAQISLQLGQGAMADDEADAQTIAEFWNNGEHERAIDALASFAAAGIPTAVGVAWQTPAAVGTGHGLAVDARLGGTRVGVSQVVLGRFYDIHVFAAIRWSAFGAEPGWSFNLSEDNGATWKEEYYWYGHANHVRDIDMLSDDAKVAYIWDGDPSKVYVQSFHVYLGQANPSPLTVYLDGWPYEKTDVAIDSYEWKDKYHDDNTDFVVAAIQADGQLFYEVKSSYHLGEASGTFVTGFFNFESGLDLSAGWSSDDGVSYIFISYIGSGRVYVLDLTRSTMPVEISPFSTRLTTLGSFNGTHPYTALMSSNYWLGPDLICMYEEDLAHGQGIRYHISEDAGDTWSSEVLVEPDATEHDYHMPFMPVHRAYAVFAQEGAGKAWFSSFSWDAMQWTPPATFNDRPCYSDAPLAVESVPEAPSGESYSFGLAYINRINDPLPNNVPYFDRAPGPGGYCHARGNFLEAPSISYVGVGTIDDHANSSGYLDRWYLSTPISRGEPHEMEVRMAFLAANGHEQCVVWVDWNQDLDFDDADETIPAPDLPDLNRWWFTITPPMDATLGETRMRIRVAASSEAALEPCDGAETGAVVDYTVEVFDYCEASGGCGQYISEVQIGDIDNTSGCAGYAYYRHLVTDVYLGQTYPITITVADGYVGNSGGLWIDWNQDLDFDDDGEQIALSASSGAGPYTADVIPPSDAAPGRTCMRVRLHREVDSPEPCFDEQQGEVEDYSLNVIDSAYCAAQGECGGYITRVQLGDINNGSGCTVGYDNYTGLETVAHIGRNYDLTVTSGGTTPDNTCSAWIDWNQDGVFDPDDPNETVSLAGTPGIGPYTASVAVPFDTPPGEALMRVRLGHGGAPGPCGATAYGEVEDYTIVIPDDPYCLGYGACGDHVYITRVQLGDIDNASDCSLGYASYTDQTTAIYADLSYDLTITVGQAVPGDACGIWIDWNHDADFDDEGEVIPVSGSPGQGPYTASIFPPPDAVEGETRMRIRVDHAPTSPPDPCGQLESGEVEDYTLTMMDAPPDNPPPGVCGMGSVVGLASAAVLGGACLWRRRGVCRCQRSGYSES